MEFALFYEIPVPRPAGDKVMQTIELMGKHVLPEFTNQEARDAHRAL